MEDRSDRIPIIVLVGSTGAGKSSLCNKLSGTNEFKVGNSLFSLTNIPQEYVCHLGGDPNRKQVKIIDLPGFNDNCEGLLGFIKLINEFKDILEKGVDIVLFCCEPKARIDNNDLYDIRNVQDMMKPENFKNNMIITLTKLDSRTDKDEIIKRYNETIEELLEINMIDFKVTLHGMLFSDFKNFEASILDPIETILSNIEPMKVEFNKVHNANLPELFKIFHTDVGQKILDRTKKRIEDKLMLKRMQHADENSLSLLKDTLDCIDIIQLKKGKTIEEINKNNADHMDNPEGFIPDLLKLYMNQEPESKEDATLFSIVRDIMREFNEEDKKSETRLSKANFKKKLMEEVENKLGDRLVQTFERLIIKHLHINNERLENLERSKVLNNELDSRLLSACFGIGAGSTITGVILSDLTIITISQGVATLTFAGVPVKIGCVGAVGAMTGLSIASILGVSVVIGIAIGALFYLCWDRDNAVDKAAKIFWSEYIKSESTFKTLVSVALSYLKIGKVLEGL